MTVVSPPALKATIASILGIKKDTVNNRYWVKYCPNCRQLVGLDVHACGCGHQRFIECDDEIVMQFSGWELECSACHLTGVGLGTEACTGCGASEFRIIKPVYRLTRSATGA